MNPKNHLSSTQKFQLAKWVEKNFDSLYGKQRAEIAAQASEALSIKVTTANIDAAAITLGVSLTGHGQRPTPANDMERLLARELLRLFQEFDLKVNPALLALANRKPLN